MTFPATMRAIAITRYGGPEVLQPTEVPVPVPGPGEVLVEVHAASVNRPDISYRIGIYEPPAGASRLPGLDIAGRVVAVGADTSRWRLGDAVCALANGGGYAEYCTVPGGQCLPVPTGMGFVQAAAIPETFFTAWVNLFEPEFGRLAHGERLLVQGGASGVGIAAIQLARTRCDARVVVTAGSADKRDFCIGLGAHAALDYRSTDWADQARACADGGYDLILDGQGAPCLAAHLSLLEAGGRLVLIATHGGTTGQVDLRDLMRRRLTLTGSTLRPRSPAFKAGIAAALEREVWPMLSSGAIRVPVGRCFDLDAAADAHRCLEAGEALGKIVLRVRQGSPVSDSA